MLYPTHQIREVFSAHPARLRAALAQRVASYERQANSASTESAYLAAMKLARACRCAAAHLAAEDPDAIGTDQFMWAEVDDCCEIVRNALRREGVRA